jgi:Lon protease-like protein
MNNNNDHSLIIEKLPIFTLKSILFPQGALALKVFEPRYLDMLIQCEKRTTGFGVCLIDEDNEVGQAAKIYSVGSLVKITFWEYHKDGLLGISVQGEQKFKIIDQYIQKNKLILADVQLLPQELLLELPEQYIPMRNVLKKIFASLLHPYITLLKNYDDASWVSARLTEFLPLNLYQKQQLFELNEPMVRLSILYDEMLKLGMLSES